MDEHQAVDTRQLLRAELRCPVELQDARACKQSKEGRGFLVIGSQGCVQSNGPGTVVAEVHLAVLELQEHSYQGMHEYIMVHGTRHCLTEIQMHQAV